MSATKLLFTPLIFVAVLLSGPGHEDRGEATCGLAGDTSATLTIEGLPYPCCVCYLETQLQKLQGVESVTTNYWEGRAAIRYGTDKISLDQLLRILRDLGIEIRPREDNFKPRDENGKEKSKDWKPKKDEHEVEGFNLA